MKSHYRFYGVAGTNGYAVYTSYDLVLRNRAKLAKVNTAGFDTFEEAKDWCVRRYYAVNQIIFVDFTVIPELKKVNQMYFREYRNCMVGRVIYHGYPVPCKDITEIGRL